MALEINSIFPVTGKLNEATNITIKGNDFGAGASVLIGNFSATNVLVVSSDTITCTVPGTLEEDAYNIIIIANNTLAILENAFIVVLDFPAYPFADQGFPTIQSRILARLPANYEKFEGSAIYDLFAPISMEFAEVYLSLGTILDLAFIVNSRGAYLDFHGIDRGIPRRKATKSLGSIKFTGVSTIKVLKGTIVSTTPSNISEQIRFITDEDVTLSLSSGSFIGTVNITAVKIGKIGNVVTNTINNLISLVPGITTVTNAAAISGGSDREDDLSYLARILSQIRTPSRAGNIEDYKQWAKAASEYVGKVGIDPLRKDENSGTAQAGTVGVYILNADGGTPSASLIKIVQDYIGPDAEGKGKAPIGANPYVAAASFKQIHVKVNITSLAGFIETDVQNFVEEAIQKYLNNLEIGDNVLYHTLGSVINGVNGVQSITDYNISSVKTTPASTDTSDIEINNTQKVSPGTITIT